VLRWSRTTSSVAVSAVILIGTLFGASADADRAAAPSVRTGQATVPEPAFTHAASAVRFFSSGNGTPLGTSVVLAGSSTSAEAAAVARMSAAQLAGQRVIYSYSGLTPPPGLLSLIRQGEAGGVLFFSANFRNRTQFTRAISSLLAANASKGNPARAYPLLLMVDQEGGLVRRLPGAPVLSEKKIGAKRPVKAAETAARQAGAGAAANLRSYRLNVNLAPVLDVYRKAGDFDDQDQRSYSTRPGIVSTLGADFITAQQKGKVAATAKHFPGLGAATAKQDTDDVPVTLNLSAKTIETFDEYPYKAAIKAGVKLVMVSWAKYPALDKKYPAGLSSTIVQEQLRTRLGFKGITITDAIGAGALRAFGTTQNRAMLAAKAGMDLILSAGESTSEGTLCRRGLQSAYTSGKLGATAFKAIVTQILALRHSVPA
jgi:beta-N-acetylhexosaminidase